MSLSATAYRAPPLTPLSFLRRAASFFADREAVVDGLHSWTYGAFHERVARLTSALTELGVQPGHRVSILLPNSHHMLEAHYAVPACGAVLNPLNTALDFTTLAKLIATFAPHLWIAQASSLPVVRQLRAEFDDAAPIVIVAGDDEQSDILDYESLIAKAAPANDPEIAIDELQPLSLLYSSGTTGHPKAIEYVHRGAYLAALSNALSFGLDHNSRHLWSWPMSHSHGLSFVWAVTAVAGTHVCDSCAPNKIFDTLREHRISEFCVPPSVLSQIATVAANHRPQLDAPVRCITGGAPPPAAVVQAIEATGIEVVHQYGSSEVYGPATVAWRRPEWDDLEAEAKAAELAVQGAPTPVVDDLRVAAMDSVEPVPRDGATLGEVLIRGNAVIAGYAAPGDAAVFSDGWFRTGDIAVWHPDGRVEIKDRAVDIISVDGVLVSSVEVESVLHQYPGVEEAAVVAMASGDGNALCAFIATIAASPGDAEALRAYCDERLAPPQRPHRFVFGPLPKTETGKVKKAELRERALGRS